MVSANRYFTITCTFLWYLPIDIVRHPALNMWNYENYWKTLKRLKNLSGNSCIYVKLILKRVSFHRLFHLSTPSLVFLHFFLSKCIFTKEGVLKSKSWRKQTLFKIQIYFCRHSFRLTFQSFSVIFIISVAWLKWKYRVSADKGILYCHIWYMPLYTSFWNNAYRSIQSLYLRICWWFVSQLQTSICGPLLCLWSESVSLLCVHILFTSICAIHCYKYFEEENHEIFIRIPCAMFIIFHNIFKIFFWHFSLRNIYKAHLMISIYFFFFKSNICEADCVSFLILESEGVNPIQSNGTLNLKDFWDWRSWDGGGR